VAVLVTYEVDAVIRTQKPTWVSVLYEERRSVSDGSLALAEDSLTCTCSFADSESEKSLSGFETTTAYSLEDSMDSKDTITSSMSEEKVCGSGESMSNGIKKHR